MYERILVTVDGSDASLAGLRAAIGLARATGGRLRLLHVVDQLSMALGMEAYALPSGSWGDELRTNGERILAQAQAEATDDGVDAETCLIDGFGQRLAATVLAEATQWRADLLVIGTHGRRGPMRLLLGSDAENILRSASLPVLMVRPNPDTPAQEARAAHPSVSVPRAALAIE